MHQEEKILLSLLKKEIVATMMQSFPGIDPEISNWKGQNITDFQEDLRIRVNGQLSEKWFYMHMKATNPSLPRIDVLNILSRYAGYNNWQDFRHKKTGKLPLAEKQGKSITNLIRIPLLLVSVMALLFIIILLINTQNYRFTFIDSDTGGPITEDNIQAELFMENESPMNYTSDAEGRITVRTNKSMIRMVVRAPYYLTDTITRTLRKFNRPEQIRLSPDSYSLMINYFSRSDVSAWEKRREQLEKMFNENATIYQLPDKNGKSGIELYNKQEFIDKLTMPSSGLRQIEVLDCRYQNGQIILLRFRLKTEME